MLNPRAHILAALLLAGVAAACSREETATPVATPAVTLNKSAPAIGSPVDMTYRFTVANDAPAFTDDYWVFAHFLDADGELMWTDDHPPSPPVAGWKPGQTIEYTRTMFIRKVPYVGRTTVQVGLFSRESGERLPLNGPTEGQRAYDVAAFDMRLESDSHLVVFKDGWHETEVPQDGREWQWSTGQSTLSFRNPKRDARIYLDVDQPVTTAEPQRVEVRIRDMPLDSFILTPGSGALRRISVPAAQFGEGETVDLTVSVDKTFVPALVPAMKSGDPRQLGIRVFRAFVEPS
jgi:hypothetical protein